MVFSTPIFLFLFLPIALSLYFLIPVTLKNGYLVAASIFFYSWGERKYAAIMLISILGNYIVALLIERFRASSAYRGRFFFIAGIIGNLVLLAGFKYLNFFIGNINSLHLFREIHIGDIRLPLGISFFTFHALSYLIDVYRGTPAMTNIVNAALYISFFPQLIAGPIVRYHDIAAQLLKRRVTRTGLRYGIRRFIQGLAKKVLVANVVALTADQIFSRPLHEVTFGSAWLGIICYTLQIYFDFSGYSDMAIGLARMFGFTFPENFNYPYAAQSITEFWRRWHISLSRWFRDYVYIPLGGSRKGTVRTCMHLLVVFLFCGLWHGASWNFILWGFLYGAILIGERIWGLSALSRLPRVVRHGYTLVVVMCMWVVFRSLDVSYAAGYLRAMGDFSHVFTRGTDWGNYLNNQVIFAMICGIILATGIPIHIRGRITAAHKDSFHPAEAILLVILFAVSLMSIASNTYNPFIYFRF